MTAVDLAAMPSAGVNMLVVSPPGCGKTELLARRALEIIPHLLPNQRILALTFTNRAKANLTERIQQLLGAAQFRRHVRIHNFHGLAAEVVLAHGRTIGLDVSALSMPTARTQKAILQRLSSDRSAISAAVDLLAAIKRTGCDDAEIIRQLHAQGDRLALQVEAERQVTNQLFYEDLLRHAQEILSIDEVANLYCAHYGAVLVDEFQDLSMQQLDIALRVCDASRTFAGDPHQGIYSWAGAQPQEVQEELERLCGDPVLLDTSYRSSPAVLNMLDSVSQQLGARQLRAADPSLWKGGGVSCALLLNTQKQEAEFVQTLCKWIVAADPAATVGVISRSGWRRKTIDSTLSQDDDLKCYRWDLAIDDPAMLDRLKSAASKMPLGTDFATAKELVLADIDVSDVHTRSEIEDIFEQLSLASHDQDFRIAVNRFRDRSDNKAISPGIHLLNAHTGKGQQFDWVLIVGLEEGHVPDRRSTSNAKELAEEQRVLLVMLSRARHGLVVTRSKTDVNWQGRYTKPASRWWPDLASSATAVNFKQLNEHLDEHYPLPGP